MTANVPEELTPEHLRFRPPCLAADELAPVLKAQWGIDGELTPLRGERDQNFRVRTAAGDLFVLKIASPLEDASLTDFQVRALQHVERKDPGLPVPRQVLSLQNRRVEILHKSDGQYAVRLLTYVDGVPLESKPPPGVDTIRDIGRLQGRLCRALADYTHAAESTFMPWDTMNGLVVSPTLRNAYLPRTLAARCQETLDRLERDSLPRMHALPHQVIHNDGHSGNVLCDLDNPERITGIIDFGDIVRRPLIVDLATSITSLADRCSDFPAAAHALVAGFTDEADLPADQRALLFDAVAARSILAVQLLTFRTRHVEPAGATRDIGVTESIEGLNTILKTGPADFLEAICT